MTEQEKFNPFGGVLTFQQFFAIFLIAFVVDYIAGPSTYRVITTFLYGRPEKPEAAETEAKAEEPKAKTRKGKKGRKSQ